MSEINWKLVEGLATWLRNANGMDRHQQAVQIMKIGEEVGEAAEATSWSEEVSELYDVALTALVALTNWAEVPSEAYRLSHLPWNPTTVAGFYGEVVQAYIGYVGQNPRKGSTHSAEDVAESLCRVARAALRDASRWNSAADGQETFGEHLNKVAARVDVKG
jgi:hypothetical protein